MTKAQKIDKMAEELKNKEEKSELEKYFLDLYKENRLVKKAYLDFQKTNAVNHKDIELFLKKIGEYTAGYDEVWDSIGKCCDAMEDVVKIASKYREWFLKDKELFDLIEDKYC